jgi:hypothetical protein
MPRVVAAPGLKVPHEKNPRTYVEAKAEHVPDTPYYRRRIAFGELVITPADSHSGKSGADANEETQPPRGSRK